MIKYLFIVINSLSLFIFSLFNGDNGITVTSTIPASIVAGQEVTFELKINKGTMNNFAKLQLEMPAGLTVKESQDKASSYNYSENTATWIWAILPADNEIVVKVVVIASENNPGAKTITAKFSYVDENNVKQQVDMTPAEINIVAAGSAVVSPGTPGATDSVVMNKTTTTLYPGSNNEPVGNINVIRTITKISDREYTVDLKIKKGITKGFAKYSDEIIEGTTTKSIKTDGSSYSVADGTLKFVWVTVPEKEELEISYTISGNFAKDITLNGEYSYLENNQSKKYKLTPETIPAAAAQATLPKEEKTEAKQPEQPVTTETVAAAKTPEENKPAEQLTTDVLKTAPATPAPAAVAEKKEGAMSFVVQIGAFTNSNTSASSLKQRFKIKEPIRSEMQDGFSKYMIGSHTEYKDARYHSEVVKDVNGIKTAFVVAYNGSKRITVQEALMISNQKWFK